MLGGGEPDETIRGYALSSKTQKNSRGPSASLKSLSPSIRSARWSSPKGPLTTALSGPPPNIDAEPMSAGDIGISSIYSRGLGFRGQSSMDQVSKFHLRKRNPRWPPRKPGSYPPRYATRQWTGTHLRLPPRLTRGAGADANGRGSLVVPVRPL